MTPGCRARFWNSSVRVPTGGIYASSPNSECLRGSNDVSIPDHCENVAACPGFNLYGSPMCTGTVLGDGPPRFATDFTSSCSKHVKKQSSLCSCHSNTNLVHVFVIPQTKEARLRVFFLASYGIPLRSMISRSQGT